MEGELTRPISDHYSTVCDTASRFIRDPSPQLEVMHRPTTFPGFAYRMNASTTPPTVVSLGDKFVCVPKWSGTDYFPFAETSAQHRLKKELMWGRSGSSCDSIVAM
jgi:hypothetical protein